MGVEKSDNMHLLQEVRGEETASTGHLCAAYKATPPWGAHFSFSGSEGKDFTSIG